MRTLQPLPPRASLSVTLLLAAVLAGCGLRLFGLDMQGLWNDELWSAAIARSTSLKEMFRVWLPIDPHPPLYAVMLFSWVRLFGDSEIALRLPSALFGAAALPAMYFLGKRVVDRNVASAATILLALSGTVIRYSQEARGYALALFLSVLATLLWLEVLKGLKEDVRLRNWLVLGLVMIILAYTHYFGLVLVLFQLVYLGWCAFRLQRHRKAVFLLAGLLFLLYAPWFVVSLPWFLAKTTGAFWIRNRGLMFLVDYAAVFFGNSRILPFLLLVVPLLWHPKGFIGSLAMQIRGLTLLSPPVALLFLVAAPLAAILLVSLHMPLTIPRYFMVFFPAIYLLISMYILAHPAFSTARGILYTFLVSFGCLLLFLSTVLYQPYKAQWREASRYAGARAGADAVVIIAPHWGCSEQVRRLTGYYFRGRQEVLCVAKVEEIDAYLARSPEIRRVFSIASVFRMAPHIERFMEQRSSACLRTEFEGVTVYEYRLRRNGTAP